MSILRFVQEPTCSGISLVFKINYVGSGSFTQLCSDCRNGWLDLTHVDKLVKFVTRELSQVVYTNFLDGRKSRRVALAPRIAA